MQTKLPENIKSLGEFKLKDKSGREDVRVTIGEGKYLHIVKVPGHSNRFRLFLETLIVKFGLNDKS